MFYETSPPNPDLLAEWRWLLGGLPRLVGWSSAGDLFYVDEHACVCRLDTGAGECEVVADSRSEFDSLLQDTRCLENLLMLPVLRAFESTHGPLPKGSCMSFTELPVLGGTYSVENRHAISIAEHAALTGDLHRQLRDLPDGTAIRRHFVP